MNKSSFFKAFNHALSGIRSFVLRDRNAKFYLICTFLVIIVGINRDLSGIEWILIFSAIFAVWITEMLNHSIEKICDLITKEYHPMIKAIKDIAAGAVLLASIYAIIIACFVLIPKYL